MRALIITLLMLSCTVGTRSQLKIAFQERWIYSNYIDFGVALHNFMGDKEFNDFISSNKKIRVKLVLNTRGEVIDIIPINASPGGKEAQWINLGNKSLDFKKFKKFLIKRNFSFTYHQPLEYKFGESEDETTIDLALFGYIPYIKLNFSFSSNIVQFCVDFPSFKNWDIHEIFYSDSRFIERGAFIRDIDIADLKPHFRLTPELYNSEIMALGILDILGEYAFDRLMKKWHKDSMITFTIETDTEGKPKKITSLNIDSLFEFNIRNSLDFNRKFIERRLICFFQNHHFRFKLNLIDKCPKKEIEVSFPGNLLSPWENETDPDPLSVFKVEQIAALIYQEESKNIKVTSGKTN